MGFYSRNGGRLGSINPTTKVNSSLGVDDIIADQLIISSGGAIPTYPTPDLILAPATHTASAWTDTSVSARSYTEGGTIATKNGFNYVQYGSVYTSRTMLPSNLMTLSNNFTLEFWAYPTLTHEIDPESNTNYPGTSGQAYLLKPNHEGANAGMGISFGTNGLSVYEHGDAYMPALLVYQPATSFPNSAAGGFTHIVIVYTNRTPTLYINGAFARTGYTSAKSTVYCRMEEIGGAYISSYQYGKFEGGVMEVKAWASSLTAAQVTALYNEKNNTYNGSLGGGQQAYTTPGTYSWTAPAGVTSVSVVAVGGGGGGSAYYGQAGAGGALGYKNNITVVPGTAYTVVVGAGGAAGTSGYGTGGNGGASTFTVGATVLSAGGGAGGAGTSGSASAPAVGGTASGNDGGGSGGAGGDLDSAMSASYSAGGGGAGGYSGSGGAGGGTNSSGNSYNPTAGSGGGGGGGGGVLLGNSSSDLCGGGGGGVGILGSGSNGSAGIMGTSSATGGGGGSGGLAGTSPTSTSTRGNGGNYGGGGGSNGGGGSSPGLGTNGLTGNGAGGAVRIIWPGTARSFPSTRTADE